MKKETVFRITAWAVLAAFSFVSCSSPFLNADLPSGGAVTVFADQSAAIPIGKGDARMFYFDSELRPSVEDSAEITALFVENNELASKVLVLSEIPDPEGDNAVRIINAENNSAVSFFYYKNQNFPYKMLISKDGEEAEGFFSLYHRMEQSYSVSFERDGGDSVRFDDFILNQNVFYLYQDQSDLNESQNIRMRHIIITLCLWESLALQMPDSGFSVNARSFGSFFSSFLTAVFCTVAVVAAAVALVACAPAAIIMTGAAISIALTTTTASVAGAIAVAAAGAALMISQIPVSQTPAAQYSPPPGPYVTIEKSGQIIANNALPPLYLAPGQEAVFDIQCFGERRDIVVSKFDPNHFEFSDFRGNNEYFDISQNLVEEILRITVKRNTESGINMDGRMQVILDFDRDAKINNTSAGVLFKESSSSQPVNRKDIFILNFTVAPPS